MIPFELFVFLLVIGGLAALAFGFAMGYQMGGDSGFEDGYDFACSQGEITWQLTAQGNSALSAERQPLAELSLHPSLTTTYTQLP